METPVGGEQSHHLVHEEGIALGLAVDRRDQARRRRDVRALLQEASDVGLGQAAQHDALTGLQASELGQSLGQGVAAAQLDVAIGRDHEQPRRPELAGEELEQQERRLVRPVQIVEHQDQGRAPRGVAQEADHRVEEAKARLLRIEARRLGQVGEDLPDLGDHARDLGAAEPEVLAQLSRLASGGVGAHDLDPGPERGCPLAFVAAPPVDLRAADARVGGELFRDARLADAGLADQEQDPRLPGEGVVEEGAAARHLLLAADEDSARQPVERVGFARR